MLPERIRPAPPASQEKSTGLHPGYVTPTLLPGVAECPEVAPISYLVPTLDEVSGRGFSINIESRCRE
jgi:hypothetical protein